MENNTENIIKLVEAAFIEKSRARQNTFRQAMNKIKLRRGRRIGDYIGKNGRPKDDMI